MEIFNKINMILRKEEKKIEEAPIDINKMNLIENKLIIISSVIPNNHPENNRKPANINTLYHKEFKLNIEDTDDSHLRKLDIISSRYLFLKQNVEMSALFNSEINQECEFTSEEFYQKLPNFMAIF